MSKAKIRDTCLQMPLTDCSHTHTHTGPTHTSPTQGQAVHNLLNSLHTRLAHQPSWLLAWGPVRVSTLMHGLASAEIARTRVHDTDSAAAAISSLSPAVHNTDTAAIISSSSPAVHTPSLATRHSSLLSLCHTVHALIDGINSSQQKVGL